MYVKLVITVSAVDTRITSTSRLVIKTHYDSCKQSYEKKIKEFVGWSERLTTTKKNTEIENNIPRVAGSFITGAVNIRATKIKNNT